MEWLIFLSIIEDMERLGIPRCTTILYLYETGRGYSETLTHKQCAEAMGVSTTTISDIENRSLMKMEEILHDIRD